MTSPRHDPLWRKYEFAPCLSVFSPYRVYMESLRRAVDLLREAEQRLQDLIAQAAGRGEYDVLPTLADWAKQLSTLAGTAEVPPATETDAEQEVDFGMDEGSPPERLPEPAVKPSPSAAVPRQFIASARGGRRRKKDEYPQFRRDGETLVKIGWSKRERKTYEHRAPRRVLEALLQALRGAGAGGARFAMENVLPLRDPEDRTEIPDYQAYLTLAWLRRTGLLTQHGRQGYSLPTNRDLNRESERLWNELPTG